MSETTDDDPYHLVLRKVGLNGYHRIGRLWQILSQGLEAPARHTELTVLRIV